MLAPAFPAPVVANQVVFRAVMDGSRTAGRGQGIAARGWGAIAAERRRRRRFALALLDYETPLWLDPPLARMPAVAEWIRFHTGARLTEDPQQAAFAIIADPAHALPFDRFALGTSEYPDRSTTLVLQVDRFGGGEGLIARRPGHCRRQDVLGRAVAG